MSEQRLCEGGVEISDAPCRVCGRTKKENCGRPGIDPRDRRIEELEAALAELIEQADEVERSWLVAGAEWDSVTSAKLLLKQGVSDGTTD